LNRLRGLPVCAIKAPGFGDTRKAIFQDVATLTGGRVISEEIGLKLDNIDIESLGKAKKIEITSDQTIIIDGGGSKTAIQDRLSQLDSEIEMATSDYEKTKMKERRAKLSSGVAVLKIGGASEVEVNEKKDRVDDALNATRAAVDEGIVAGGGSALLYASKVLDSIKLDNFDQNRGLEILKLACRAPCKTIADNAGVEGSEGALVVGKLLEYDDHNMGFNAQDGTYVNMLKAGIVDPTKVVRTALVDAASVASLMSTTEAMIVELPKKEENEALEQ